MAEVSIAAARERLTELVSKVGGGEGPVYLTGESGEPVAALIGAATLHRLLRAQQELDRSQQLSDLDREDLGL